MRARGLLLLPLWLGLACGPGPEPEPEPDDGYEERPVCHRAYTQVPPIAGNLGEGLEEVSGVASSPTTPGLLWMHADSGNEPLLFAVRDDGGTIGTFRLDAPAVDLEDIASARCTGGDGFCLYIADTGDNARARDDVELLIAREPEVNPAGVFSERPLAVERIPVRYPGGESIDVEALAISAAGDRAFLFEKVDARQARVFAGALGGDALVLEEIATIQSPGVDIALGKMITAADLHPSGARLAVRVYTGVFEYLLDERGVDGIAELTPNVVTFGPLDEPQGEALGYDIEGIGLWSVSEDPDGEPGQPLHHFQCD